MDNLAVTIATFGTDSLVATGTEYLPATTQAQVANNTGWLYYRPQHVCDQGTDVAGGTESQCTYMLAGTYQAYTRGSSHVDVAGTTSIFLDGTLLATDTTAGANWMDDNAEVIISDDKWAVASFAHTDGGSGRLRLSTIAVRRKV